MCEAGARIYLAVVLPHDIQLRAFLATPINGVRDLLIDSKRPSPYVLIFTIA